MWEVGFKFNYVWSLLLFFGYLGTAIQAFNSNLDSNGGVAWDWMQTGTLGMVQGGQWLRPSHCPDGSFVTRYQMKYGQENATGEITGLRLHCSILDQNYKLKTVRSLHANEAFISNQNSLSVTSNGQAVGFSMARWTDSQGVEFVGGRRLKFMEEDESTKSKYSFRFPRKTNSTLLVSVGCPEDWAICGVQAREKDVDEGEPILTQLRFKCCYYCTPQEKRVILDDVTNPESTDYTRTIRRTVGTQFDRRGSTSGSNLSSKTKDSTKEIQKVRAKYLSTSQSESEGTGSDTTEGSLEVGATFGFSGFGVSAEVLINGRTTRQSPQIPRVSIQRAKERSIQEGVQSMFIQRHGEQQSWGFNWDQSDSSIWREERKKVYSFTCEAMHRCKIEQVYGTCGALRIRTTKIEKTIKVLKHGQYRGSPEPAPETVSNNTQEIQSDINLPGETWVVAKGISQWEPSGHWQNVQVCPPDTIVTGHMFKYLPRAGLSGIALVCSGKYGPDEGEKEHDDVNILRISSEDDSGRNGTKTRGRWGNVIRGSRSIFAEGYSFARREMNGRRSTGNQEIIYNSMTLMNIPSSVADNSSTVVTKCPQDHAICGLTAMMDKSEIGVLTAVGFKCCHHCIPEEKWLTIHRIENESPSEEQKEVRTTVGLPRSPNGVPSDSVNVNSGATTATDSAGISRSGLRKGFSARFGKSSSTGFDWSHTKNSIWRDEITVVEKYTCEPFSSCVYRKLVGQCGSVRVPVEMFAKKSTPLEGYAPIPTPVPVPGFAEALNPVTKTGPITPSPSPGSHSRALRVYPNQYNLEDELTPVLVLKNGEIWIEAQNIQIQHLGEYTNPIWGKSESCPLGSFVTGYRLLKLGGEDEDTQNLLIGLELECSRWDAGGNFQKVKMIPGGQLSNSSASSTRPGQSISVSDADGHLVQNKQNAPAVGFHLFVDEWFDEDGQLAGQDTRGHSLIFDRWSTPESPIFDHVQHNMNVFEEKVLCPTDYVICGMRTKKDGGTGILTDIRFQCCYHCEPSETEEELDNQENPTNVTVTHPIPPVKIGAVVEVKNPIVEGSAPDTLTLLKGFSDYQYPKEMFSHRLPKTSKTPPGPGQPKVNWQKQHKSLWTREIEIPKVNHCTPGHNCVVTQVVGHCGKLRIPTIITPTQYILIDQDQDQEEDGGAEKLKELFPSLLRV